MSPSSSKLAPALKPDTTWSTRVSQHNVYPHGIEVLIPSDYKPRHNATAETTTSRITHLEVKHSATSISAPPSESPPPSVSAFGKKTLRYLASRSLLATCGLLVLGNVPVYSMVHTDEQKHLLSLLDDNLPISPAQIIKQINLPAVPVETYSGYAVDILPDAQQGSWTMRTVGDTDTLDSILKSFDLTRTAQKLLGQSAIKQELKSLQPGSRLLVQVVEGRLLQLIYVKTKTDIYIVSATDKGYVGKWDNRFFDTRETSLAFTVKRSIERDGKEAGISNSVIRQLKEVFSKDTDFSKVRIGDKVSVIFEDFHYQGQSIYTDKIIAAEYATRSKRFQRLRYTLMDGTTDYFSPNDDTALKRVAFDREPLEGRISSEFGMRFHPVFGFMRQHTGVDFAAPYGTPIHATADGVVKFIGQQNGYGNMIELRHDNEISTLYGHMSAFLEGLKSGDKIKRGDVIGYVGSTGTSTGNHVHYEYRIAGQPQDPLTVELPQVGLMSAKEAVDFKKFATAKLQELTELRKLASLSRTLKSDIGG